MSHLNTKPRWFPAAVPTARGWTNPQTGEVLIAIGNLLELLRAEGVDLTQFGISDAQEESPVVFEKEPEQSEAVEVTSSPSVPKAVTKTKNKKKQTA